MSESPSHSMSLNVKTPRHVLAVYLSDSNVFTFKLNVEGKEFAYVNSSIITSGKIMIKLIIQHHIIHNR